MKIRGELMEIIETRVCNNLYLLEDNDRYQTYEDNYDTYSSQLVEKLDDEGKKLLDEVIANFDRKNQMRNCLSYIVGASDELHMKTIFDSIT